MAEFDHVAWGRLVADLALNPLSAGDREFLIQIERANCADIPAPEGREGAIVRLLALGLISGEPPTWDDCDKTYRASWLLRAITARGLFDELLGCSA